MEANLKEKEAQVARLEAKAAESLDAVSNLQAELAAARENLTSAQAAQ